MKKALSPINIDKKIYHKIEGLLNAHRELGYKSKVQFVENAIEEKLDAVHDRLILTKIRESGLGSFVDEAKDIQQKIERGKATSERLSKLVDKHVKERQARKKKHTPHVYKSKKK